MIDKQGHQTLRERLIAGYLANAASDKALAVLWETLEDEVWLMYIPPYEGEEPT
jgi:hypothetical protein